MELNTKKQNINLLIITLHANPSMPPGVGEWGGTHTYMRELLMSLAGENINVLLVTRKVYETENDIEQISENCRIAKLEIGGFDAFDKRNLYYHHEYTKEKIKNLLKTLEYSVDVIHSVYWNSGQVAMELSQEINIPYVHSVISNAKGRILHGANGTSEFREAIEISVFNNARYIICVSESERDEIIQYYNIKPEKFLIAGQYVHPSFLFPAHNSYGYPRKSSISHNVEQFYWNPLLKSNNSSNEIWWANKNFAYVGRICTDKGVDKIIHAWYKLVNVYKESCPSLWIIGGSPQEISLLRSILEISETELTQLEENNKLVWWGYLDEAGISALYTRVLALITHSLYEPGGRVAVEAMCESIPVIATPNGFALDNIKNWYNGFLVSYGDIEQLSFRMEHFIKQPYLSNVMGINAKEAGINIVEKSDFKNTHFRAYLSCRKPETNLIEISEERNPKKGLNRYLDIFPYNESMIDQADIVELLKSNNIINVNNIKKISPSNSSSFFWCASTNDDEYYIKIPYDRINMNAIWAQKKEVDLVIKSSDRYYSEKHAVNYNGIAPVIFYNDTYHAIIRNKVINKLPPYEEIISIMFAKLNQIYENDVSSFDELFNKINSMINQRISYQEIDKTYNQILKSNSIDWLCSKDYSLRVELMRWKNYLLSSHINKDSLLYNLFNTSYERIWKIASDENNNPIVLSHGGCDMKNLLFNNNKIILVDNENLHPSWPGIDFSDFLITYTRKYAKVENKNWWSKLLSSVPSKWIDYKITAAWIILGTYKEIISESSCLNDISTNLIERIHILLELCNQ